MKVSLKSFSGLFAKIPATLYLNDGIRSYERDVYAVIYLLEFSGQTSSQAAIAAFLRISTRQVRLSIAKLESAKAINIKRAGRGINTYSIVQAAEPAQPVVKIECAHCHRQYKALRRTGLCYRCHAAADLQRQVNGARRVLGADATAAQIDQHIRTERRLSKITAAMRRTA